MSKSILVIDAPEGCIRCDCCHTKDYDFRERIDGEKICGIENMNVDDYCDGINLRKPDWCPIRDLPEKKPKVKYQGNGCFGINEAMKNSFYLGFNACIDELLKGENENE